MKNIFMNMQYFNNEAGVPAWLCIFSNGEHGTVSPDIEKASADWIVSILLNP